MKRRFALALAVVMLAALCLSGCGGSAQTGEDSQSSSSAGGETTGSGNWPNDSTIRLICGFSAGGSSDLMCRIFAEALGKELGQTVVVENLPGSGGHVSWNEVVHNTEPDGYTICVINSPGICICKEQAENP